MKSLRVPGAPPKPPPQPQTKAQPAKLAPPAAPAVRAAPALEAAPKAAAARDVEPPSSPEPELPPSDDEAEYEDEVIGLEDDEARPPPPVASARGLKRPAAPAAIDSPENADPHSSAAWQSAKSPAPAPMHKRRNVVNDSDDDD